MDFLERWESKSPEERQSALQSEEQTLADDPRGSVAATDTQKAILTQEIESAPVSPYTLNFSYSITGPVAIDRIKRAVEDTLLSHPILNTRYLFKEEAYSVAGEMGFGWWLVEHYLPYHVNRPNSCGLGESTRGRKDPPYFQMGYGSFDNIADLVDPFVESFLPVQ